MGSSTHRSVGHAGPGRRIAAVLAALLAATGTTAATSAAASSAASSGAGDAGGQVTASPATASPTAPALDPADVPGELATAAVRLVRVTFEVTVTIPPGRLTPGYQAQARARVARLGTPPTGGAYLHDWAQAIGRSESLYEVDPAGTPTTSPDRAQAVGTGWAVTSGGHLVTLGSLIQPGSEKIRNAFAVSRRVANDYYFARNVSACQAKYPGATRLDCETVQRSIDQWGTAHMSVTDLHTSVRVIRGPARVSWSDTAGDVAQILWVGAGQDQDLAVLQVPGTGSPTALPVGDAAAVQPGTGLSTSGYERFVRYLDRVSDRTIPPAAVRVSAGTPGAGPAPVFGMLRAGHAGAPLVDRDGRAVGVVSVTGDAHNPTGYTMTPVNAVRPHLAALGAASTGSPAQQAYLRGLRAYADHHFSAALPDLEQATRLDPGNPRAPLFLAEARRAAGTDRDVPVPTTGPGQASGPGPGAVLGSPWLWGGAGVAVIAVLAGGLLAVRRSRRRAQGVPPPGVESAPPVPQALYLPHAPQVPQAPHVPQAPRAPERREAPPVPYPYPPPPPG